ncbi:MAG: nickel-binding protein [Myxococcota bacterium]
MRLMDIHDNMVGLTEEQLRQAHEEDLRHEDSEGVLFIRSWADPASGKVLCLSEGSDKEAVRRVHAKSGHPPDEIHEVSQSVE